MSESDKPSENNSSQSEYEHEMDPKLRQDILNLLNKPFDEMPENELVSAEIERGLVIRKMLLEEDFELFKLFDEKHISTDQQETKEFFSKKSSKGFTKQQLQKFDSHFSSEYHRHENVIEVREIIEMYMKNHITSNIALLVQPLMCGKSRLVCELAKTVPTVYVCFGKNKESRTSVSMRFFQELLRIKDKSVRKKILIYRFVSIVKRLISMDLDFEALWKRQALGEESFFDECLKVEKYKADETQMYLDVWNEYTQKVGITEGLQLLFVFDEARFLFKQSLDRISLLGDIRRALNTVQYYMRGIFILLVDSSLQDDDSSDYEHPKSVFYSGPDPSLNAPIYTFDTFDTFLDCTVSLSDVSSNYRSMGRPGWSKLEPEKVTNIARKNILLGDDRSDQPYMNGTVASVMCIYAVELKRSTELAKLLIQSHMAFPKYISPSRDYVSCFYRSEPALVLGAHAALCTQNVLEAFSFLLQNDEIETGERGVVIARLLITHCVTEYCSVNGISRCYGLNLLSLSEFFHALHLQVPSSQIPETGKVHLTHWIQVPCKLQPHILLKCFFRGAAIVCKNELFIPVFIDTPENQNLIDGLNLSHSDIDGSTSLGDVENEIKRVFSVVAVQVENQSSEVFNRYESFKEWPFILHLQMNGSFKQDKVVIEHDRVKLFRQSVEAWNFSNLDLEYIENVLMIGIKPQDLEGDDAQVLAEKRETFLLRFRDTRNSPPNFKRLHRSEKI